LFPIWREKKLNMILYDSKLRIYTLLTSYYTRFCTSVKKGNLHGHGTAMRKSAQPIRYDAWYKVFVCILFCCSGVELCILMYWIALSFLKCIIFYCSDKIIMYSPYIVYGITNRIAWDSFSPNHGHGTVKSV
jgi:hypothetical protein